MASKNLEFPKTCYIKESTLYKNESKKLLKAKIVSIQAYKNFDLCFQILIDDKFLYSNISVYDIVHINDIVYFQNMVALPYIKCVDHRIDVYTIEYLTGREVNYFVDGARYQGVYLTSIDFYEDNEQLHLIKANNGTFVFVPNHKIIFTHDRDVELPKFKKL